MERSGEGERRGGERRGERKIEERRRGGEEGEKRRGSNTSVLKERL